MVNNTTSGHRVIKQNITPNTSGIGGTAGAIGQDHFSWFGTFTANGSTPVTVTDPNVSTNCIISFTLKTVGGTVGACPVIQTITPGTGFTVAATAGDTSVYAYSVDGYHI